MDFEESYIRESEKRMYLAERISELERENRTLQSSIERIRNNPLWKLSLPARRAVRLSRMLAERIRKQKKGRGYDSTSEAGAFGEAVSSAFGTGSFPDEETRTRQEQTTLRYMPQISILVPLFNTPEPFLRAMIESVLRQTYKKWQLCLADGSDNEHAAAIDAIVKEYQHYLDDDFSASSKLVYKRVEKNEGISGNTNQCFKMATGDFVGLLDHDDVLHPEALFWYVKAINDEEADYIYCDEATFVDDDIDKMITLHFKPDYAIDNLRANNYICHFSVFKRSLQDGDELLKAEYDGSQDHDMALRLTDRAENIVHIPRILYYWRAHPESVSAGINAKPYAIDAAKGAIASHLRNHGFNGFSISSTRAFETIFKVTYAIVGTPKVSIVIPNKDHVPDLRRCVDSIIERTTYRNFEIVIVENGSNDAETRSFYDDLRDLFSRDIVRILDYDNGVPRKAAGEGGMPFSFSSVVNYGVRNCDGEYVVLLNNDTQVISNDWLEELLMYAQRDDVGAVGAKLYFPNGTIQHAGVVLQMGAHRTAGHSHYGVDGDDIGYMGRLCYAQDVSAVTAACLMVSREKFDLVGGFDERFVVSLNDIDFCLKLRERGFLNVFNPFAELYHYESLSRGTDSDGERAVRYEHESKLFREKWESVLEKGDPYFNPNLSLDKSVFTPKALE